MPFPPTLAMDSMAVGAEEVNGVFPADSSTACMVVAFVAAVLKERTPTPDSVAFKRQPLHYTVRLLNSACPKDGGPLEVRVTTSQVILHCDGPKCKSN